MGDQETGVRSSESLKDDGTGYFKDYRSQDKDVNFGGGITSNWFISGFHG